MNSWVNQATEKLLSLRVKGEGWSYRAGDSAATEPTVLACLSLLAVDPENSSALEVAARSSKWLKTLQTYDGAVRSRASDPPSGWNTSYALLLWLTLGAEHHAADSARAWLLGSQGLTFDKPSGSPLGHDTTLPGWSWAERTHSWLEPTALAVLALRRDQLQAHARVQMGLALIRDRVIPEGGWNFGNNTVFGRSLRPKPGPTGLALLALSGTCAKEPFIQRSLDYLKKELPHVRAAQSLGLGSLGLAVWGEQPNSTDAWLAESFERVRDRHDAAPQLAYLLLASTHQSLSLLGLSSGKGDEREG